ncbi:MAG: endonuclease MutS2 [Termitinemataceae bacterium]|nr:MAG: endonuclease MutS2 [Termitinemataceae bacterium]
MIEKTYKLLEYNKIMDAVADFASSNEAADLIRSSVPLYNMEGLENLKSKVASIMRLIKESKDEPLGRLPDVNNALLKLKVEGSALTIEEAFDFGMFLKNGIALKAWVEKAWVEKTQGAEDVLNCHDEIFKVIDSNGKMRESAQMHAIRQRIAAINRDLITLTSSFTHGEKKNMLQSDVPTQRDGRIVLAVRSNFKAKISGIVHDVSSGGGTIFIEPEAIVEKNNDLFIEERALDAEIRRILRSLSEILHSKHEDLKKFYDEVIEIELIRARAKYSLQTKGNFAKNGAYINLKQVRHPLLGKECVPLDINLSDLNLLLISGPNSGGKTIALKTSGLAALMNQSGLAISAAEGSTLPIFAKILADIGDEQSIDNELSTFSAHISNVAEILQMSASDRHYLQGEANALILFDELCSGTDPQEGSALAMAILDYLQKGGSTVLVSTHHGALKNYIWGRAGAQNASAAFDEETLAPSYALLMGVPGESRALDIAARYGLPLHIVDGARVILSNGHADIASLIKGVSEKMQAAIKKELELNEREAELSAYMRKLDAKELKLMEKEASLKDGSLPALREFLGNSRKTLENLVRELKEQGAQAINRDQTLKVKEFLKDLEKSVSFEIEKTENFVNETKKLKRAHINKEAPPFNIECGMQVLVGDNKRPGTVKRAGKNGMWIVDVGNVSMPFDAADLQAATAVKKTNSIKGSVTVEYANGNVPPAYELRLLGMRAVDAMEAMQTQMERALQNGLKEFSVIHGKGDGILQTLVHEFLRRESSVAEFYFAPPQAGGSGKTFVMLKN